MEGYAGAHCRAGFAAEHPASTIAAHTTTKFRRLVMVNRWCLTSGAKLQGLFHHVDVANKAGHPPSSPWLVDPAGAPARLTSVARDTEQSWRSGSDNTPRVAVPSPSRRSGPPLPPRYQKRGRLDSPRRA